MTTNPRLDAALGEGWRRWEETVASTSLPIVLTWLRHRTGAEVARADLEDGVRNLVEADDPEERLLARAELAELLEGVDNPLAETLWEGVLATGYEIADADTIFDGVSHLAALAETAGDLLGAAEWYIEFLNWRRRDEHAADPDQVGTGFEEIVRLADEDGARTAAAQWTYRQAIFTRLLERDPGKAEIGDWERSAPPYQSWA